MNKNTVRQNQVDKILEESEVVVSTLWGKCTVVAIQSGGIVPQAGSILGLLVNSS